MSRKKAKIKILVPDLHFGMPRDKPAQKAFDCCNAAIKLLKPDQVIQLGDITDGAVFSSHAKKTLKECEQESYIESELEPAIEWLDFVQKHSKSVHIVYGNHDHSRVERFIVNNFGGALARELVNLLSPRVRLQYTADGRKRKNFTFTKYAGELPLYKINPKCYATHGFSHGQNAARNHLKVMPAGKSIIFGHCHTRLEASKRDPITGEMAYAWCPGALVNTQPHYFSSPSNHSHGFGVMYESRTNPSDFTYYQVSIVNGRCILPDGREVKV